jgi:hypothetical protein
MEDGRVHRKQRWREQNRCALEVAEISNRLQRSERHRPALAITEHQDNLIAFDT